MQCIIARLFFHFHEVPMLRSVAVARIKQGLAFRRNLDDVCVGALQEAQREFEIGTTLPWFLISKDQPLLTVASTREIALPTNFIRFVEDEGPRYVTTDGVLYFALRPFAELDYYYRSTDSGAPAALALRSDSLAVFPLPDAEYTITASYYAKAAVLDSDIENLWLQYFPDLLISRAGMIVAGDIEHAAAEKKFSAKYDMWLKRYFSEMAAREDSSAPHQMGVNN